MSTQTKFLQVFHYKNVNIRLNYKRIITKFLCEKLFTRRIKKQQIYCIRNIKYIKKRDTFMENLPKEKDAYFF